MCCGCGEGTQFLLAFVNIALAITTVFTIHHTFYVVIPFLLALTIEFTMSLIHCCGSKKFIKYHQTTEEMKKNLKKLIETGPTIVKSEMKNNGDTNSDEILDHDDWECVGLFQFEYETWKNEKMIGVEKLEKMLNNNKTFFLHLSLEIECEKNYETERAERQWSLQSVHINFDISKVVTSSSTDLCEFHQDPRFSFLTLPEYIKPDKYIREFHQDRRSSFLTLPEYIKPDKYILVNEPKLCGYSVFYMFAYWPIFGAIFRLLFQLCVREVRVSIKKTYNSRPQRLSDGVFPFKNNLENFSNLKSPDYIYNFESFTDFIMRK